MIVQAWTDNGDDLIEIHWTNFMDLVKSHTEIKQEVNVFGAYSFTFVDDSKMEIRRYGSNFPVIQAKPTKDITIAKILTSQRGSVGPDMIWDIIELENIKREE